MFRNDAFQFTWIWVNMAETPTCQVDARQTYDRLFIREDDHVKGFQSLWTLK